MMFMKRVGGRTRVNCPERGAVAVEAALVTPLLFLLVFGIIEFGFVFKDWLGASSAVRAGARIASAEPRQADFAQDAANQVAREGAALDLARTRDLWVYKANGDGYPMDSGNSFGSCDTKCVHFDWKPGSDGGKGHFAPTSGSWASSDQDACQGGQDDVGVYLAVNRPAVTGLFFGHLTLTSHTVMRLEPVPSLYGKGCGPES
jgi:hypothetical protein